MPIKSLTNRQPQFPEIGQLRKGAKKPQKGIGRDLDHFRFTSDIPEVQETFDAEYNGKPRLINVFLPYQYVDENWEAWQEHWVAGGLKHRCDGELVVRQQNGDGTYTDPEPGTVECPGNCKPVGRLQVIIPELKRLAYVTVLTSSKYDIANLDSQLRALQSLTINGDLRGVPLQLRRRKKKIRKRMPDGKRTWGDSWLLSIEAAPSWWELQLAAQKAAAIPQLPQPDAIAVLPDGAVVVNGTTGELLSGDDNGPDWDEVPGQDEEDEWEEPVEEEFEPPPDALQCLIPAGKYAGKTMGELLDEDPNYLTWVSHNAKSAEIKECARISLQWQESMQPALL